LRSRVAQWDRWLWKKAARQAEQCGTPHAPEQRSRTRPASRAYYKWVELQEHHPALKLARGECALHLGEGPGGFLQASREHGGGNTTHYGYTLGGTRFCDWSEVVRGLPGVQLHYRDLLEDGDLAFSPPEQDGKADLVTADGATDWQDEDRQEVEVYPLLQREWSLGLRHLAPGGHLVLKIFGVSLPCTWSLLQEARHYFTTVTLDKPPSSRGGNSERYLVCLGYVPTEIPVPERTPEDTALYTQVDQELCRTQCRVLEEAHRRAAQLQRNRPSSQGRKRHVHWKDETRAREVYHKTQTKRGRRR